MRKSTAYDCPGCSRALYFDADEHTLSCESCGRRYRRNLQPL